MSYFMSYLIFYHLLTDFALCFTDLFNSIKSNWKKRLQANKLSQLQVTPFQYYFGIYDSLVALFHIIWLSLAHVGDADTGAHAC